MAQSNTKRFVLFPIIDETSWDEYRQILDDFKTKETIDTEYKIDNVIKWISSLEKEKKEFLINLFVFQIHHIEKMNDDMLDIYAKTDSAEARCFFGINIAQKNTLYELFYTLICNTKNIKYPVIINIDDNLFNLKKKNDDFELDLISCITDTWLFSRTMNYLFETFFAMNEENTHFVGLKDLMSSILSKEMCTITVSASIRKSIVKMREKSDVVELVNNIAEVYEAAFTKLLKLRVINQEKSNVSHFIRSEVESILKFFASDNIPSQKFLSYITTKQKIKKQNLEKTVIKDTENPTNVFNDTVFSSDDF